MSIPSLKQTEVFMNEAQELNPGSWVRHSLFVGKAAMAIASNHPKLDAQTPLSWGTFMTLGEELALQICAILLTVIISLWKKDLNMQPEFA